MRKFNIIFSLLLLLTTSAAMAQDMPQLFVEAPDTVLPLLTRNNRADCIDFLDAKMRARVTNRLDGRSELLSISDDFLELRNSESSMVQMKLLPFAEDTIIAVVRSVCAEACDSRLSFYNKDWSPAKATFSRPPIKDFFIATDSLDYFMARCDIYLVHLSLSPVDNVMTADYTMPQYMSEEDSALVAPKLRTLRYRWNGARFVKE